MTKITASKQADFESCRVLSSFLTFYTKRFFSVYVASSLWHRLAITLIKLRKNETAPTPTPMPPLRRASSISNARFRIGGCQMVGRRCLCVFVRTSPHTCPKSKQARSVRLWRSSSFPLPGHHRRREHFGAILLYG